MRTPSVISSLILATVAVTAFALTACDGNSLPADTPGLSISSAGGTIEIDSGPLAGTKLVIAPNSASRPASIAITLTQDSLLQGSIPVGPGTNLSPTDVVFDPPAMATLVFDPDLVPANATTADFVIKRRNDKGRIVDLRPAAVDLTNGTAQIELSDFAAFWVAVELPRGFNVASYLPLFDRDYYEFDSGLTLAMRLSFDTPNLEGFPVVQAAFDDGVDDITSYLSRDENGTTFVLGWHSVSENVQSVYDLDVPWLPPSGKLGATSRESSTFLAYEPFRSLQPTSAGSVTVETRILSRGRLDTPLGRFDDVLEVEVATTTETNFTRMTMERWWLARGVGPVQVELEGLGKSRLVFARVGGFQVTGR